METTLMDATCCQRLVTTVLSSRFTLLEAPAGYRKTLVLEAVKAALEQDPGALGITAVIAVAAQREGDGLAASLGEAQGCAPDRVLAAAARGAFRATAVLVDDADRNAADALLLQQLAAVGEPPLLAIATRGLAGPLASWRPPLHGIGGSSNGSGSRPIWVGAETLAFTPEEAALLASDHGLVLHEEHIALLMAATDGWPVALMTAIERLAEAQPPAPVLDGLLRRNTVVPARVVSLLRRIQGQARERLICIAHLPPLRRSVIDAVYGPALMDGFLDTGLPVYMRADGRWDLPRGVRSALSAVRPVARPEATRLAHAHEQDGDADTALQILEAARSPDEALALLGRLDGAAAEELSWERQRPLVQHLVVADEAGHPDAALRLLRAAEFAGDVAARDEVLVWLARAVDRDVDTEQGWALRAEAARELARTGRAAAASKRGRLARDRAQSAAARGRAALAVGEAVFLRDAEDYADLARRWFDEAAARFREAREPGWQAEAYLRGAEVERSRARPVEALRLCRMARPLAPSGLAGAVVLIEGFAWLQQGEVREAQAALERLRTQPEPGNRARAGWLAAELAAQRQDAAGTVRALLAVERDGPAWPRHREGAAFLLGAADLLGKVGHENLAQEYVARARLHPAAADAEVVRCAAILAARSGDPDEAERVLSVLERAIRTRDRWRVTLFRAHAAMQRGDPRTAAFARDAFDAAAAAGDPRAPLREEPVVSRPLVAIAGREGSSGANSLMGEEMPVSVFVLGGFDVRVGGAPVKVKGRMPQRLLKLLAIEPRGLHWEVVSEHLWPGDGAREVRSRLRNVVARVREVVPHSILRQGEMLRLAPDVEVDALMFDLRAREALAMSDPDLAVRHARQALIWYGGELLPDDRFESWAQEPRERLQRRWLAVVGLLADDAERRGELDEALELLENARAHAAFDDRLYVRIAELLIRQERLGPAAAIIKEGKAQLALLGVHESPALEALARRLREG